MSYTPLFTDRTDAGEKLAQKIDSVIKQSAASTKRPIVYALPRGGLPVAAPVARLLGCPLTIMVAKKISHPQNPELAIGAVTASGNVLWNEQKLNHRQNYLRSHSADRSAPSRELALNLAIDKAKILEEQLIPGCPQVNTENATVILIDDGIATGMTIAVAAIAAKALGCAEVWLCAPLAPLKLLPWLSQWCDRLIILETPEPFLSVSHFYVDFPQVECSEALVYLQQQHQPLTD
ncbi:phosphoribosyltransferase family protein [Plectonema radiosum NIES-515]|uniref:Phosphoribosyltransferase family protein n=1 Tax=Plectonema radiosum NIES-515 TaxID=2986073 RepID=A0ABT3AWW7_9CYAN|nr:phosphoribosyltransferase family protein [Plectonema radiosum]MCV3213611.1 phosphoribosyltransferase family protein [Plectonema radiosum NIES-515]